MCDLKNDNYYKLISAEIPADINEKSRLKVYKGTKLVNDQGLPGIPSAVESFYIDEYEPKVPVIAVSIDSSVLLYRNMKPYYKYTMSSMPIEPLEIEVWKQVSIHMVYFCGYMNRFILNIEHSFLVKKNSNA